MAHRRVMYYTREMSSYCKRWCQPESLLACAVPCDEFVRCFRLDEEIENIIIN